MAQIFNGKLHVHYGQAYIFTYREWDGHMDDCFVGQINGLCGTAIPGIAFLITGLHTGEVDLIIESLASPPTVNSDWEEIVEAPFTVGPEVDKEGPRLESWNGKVVCKLPLDIGSYRIRYCARKMDEANSVDTLLEDEGTIDSYALYIWPSAIAPDAIVKQTPRVARSWHQHVQDYNQRTGSSRNPDRD